MQNWSKNKYVLESLSIIWDFLPEMFELGEIETRLFMFLCGYVNFFCNGKGQ